MRRNITAFIGLILALAGLLLPLGSDLAALTTTVGASALLYAAMDVIVGRYPGLTGDARWLLSVALAFVIPAGAYLLRVYLGQIDFDRDGLIAALSVGLILSQGIHRTGEAVDRNSAPPDSAP